MQQKVGPAHRIIQLGMGRFAIRLGFHRESD
jgi:hypothetical protein